MTTKSLEMPSDILSEKVVITPEMAAFHNEAATNAFVEGVKIFFDNVKTLGVDAGKGASTIFGLAMAFQNAVADKLVSQDDALKVYTAYAAGYVDGSSGATGIEAMSSGSIQAQASILKTFGSKAAIAANECDLYGRANRLRKEIAAEDKTGSAYSNFATLNRKAIAEVEKTGKLETIVDILRDPVEGDAWILSHIRKAAAPVKSDIDKLKDVAAALAKLAKSDTFAGNTMVAGLAAYTHTLHSHLSVKPFEMTLAPIVNS